MKKLLLPLVLLLLCVAVSAQTSKGFSFQGYARGTDGSALQNKNDLQVRFTIFTTDVNNPDFLETQTLSTDEFGVFTAVIGTVNTSAFNSLNFAANDYKLKIELNDGGSWNDVATQSLLAVPYAKASERASVAEKVTDGGNGVPVGSIIPFAGPSENIPDGWLLCDGTTYSAAEYAELYQAIGTYWGGTTSNFKVPDLRSMFLRGANANRTVGVYEGQSIQSHNHNLSSNGRTNSAGGHTHDMIGNNGGGGGLRRNFTFDGNNNNEIHDVKKIKMGGTHSHTLSGRTENAGSTETRPVNMSVNYIIKY